MDEIKRFPQIGRLIHLERAIAKLPDLPQTLTFEGTVKLHGCNIGFVQETSGDTIRVQSRNRYLTLKSDNAGSATFLEQRRSVFAEIFSTVRKAYDNYEGRVLLFGEIVGKGVQKFVGVAEQDKFVMLFDAEMDNTRKPDLLREITQYHGDNIYNVYEFPTYLIRVDKTALDSTEADAFAVAIGEDCPAARQMGTPGHGEGVVWRCVDKKDDETLWFKSKAPYFCIAAKASHPVPVKPTCAEIQDFANGFADNFTTPARLAQGVYEICGSDGLDKQHIQAFVKWVVNDVISEEGKDIPDDMMPAVRKAISKIASTFAKDNL